MAILLEATTVGGHTVWHSGNLDLGEYAPLNHDHGDQYVFAIENPIDNNFLIAKTDGIVESSIYNFESFSLINHTHDSIYSRNSFSIIEPNNGDNIYSSVKNDILRFKRNPLGESNIEITSDPATNTLYFRATHPTISAASSTTNLTSFIKNLTLDSHGHILDIESSDIGNLSGGFVVESFNGLSIPSNIDSQYANRTLGVNSDATAWAFYRALPEITGLSDSYKRVIVKPDASDYMLSEYDVYGNIYLEFDDDGNLMPQRLGSEIGEVINPILHDINPEEDRHKVLRLNYDGTGFDLLPTTGIGDSHFMVNESQDLTPLPYGAEFAYISPPPIQWGDFGKVLRVKSDETGYELTRIIPNTTSNDQIVLTDHTNNSLKFVDFATENEVLIGTSTNKPITPNTLSNWPFKGPLTIYVGYSADFLTINDAINYLISRPRLGTAYANIIINSGYILTEQIIADSRDLSWITISSNSEIEVSRMHLTLGYRNSSIFPIFAAINNGKLPIINTLFNMNTSGDTTGRSGIYCDNGSSCSVMKNAGIKNAAHIGVAAYNNSTVQMEETDFSDSKGMGVFCSGSRVIMNKANVTGANSFGIRSWNGGFIVASEANCKREATDTTDDITVGNSSMILCPNAYGGLNQAPNLVTSHGVIVR